MSRPAAAWTIGLCGIVVIAAVCWFLDDRVGSVATAGLMLAPIVAASAVGGRRIGLWVAVIGAAAYAAIFITPLGHVTVGPTQDGLVLAVFIAVGLLIGTVTDRRRPTVPAVDPRQLDDDRAIMLSAVSHDLRNPLSTIRLASSDLLTEVDDQDGRQAELISLVLSESERLDRIVENLLSAGRVQAGTLQPTLSPEPISSVIENCRIRFTRIHPEHAIELDLDRSTPDAMIDAVQIDQVLTNLVENARRASSPDSPIVISSRHVGRMIEVSVIDRGTGFAPEMLEDAFEPHRSTTGSSGLGLAVCKAIVEAHCGTVRIGVAPDGCGAAVVFTVPAVPR